MRRLALTLGLLLFTACSQNQQSENTEPIEEEMPPVTFLDGRAADLDDLVAGKPAIVNFWAASCAFCRHELPLFEEIHIGNESVVVVGVNMQESTKIARDYWQDGGYTFKTLLDPENILRRRFKASIQPTTVFLDASGIEVDRKDGPLGEEELHEKVATMLGIDVNEVISKDKEEPNKDSEEPKEFEESTEDVEEEVPEEGLTQSINIQTSDVPRELSSWYEGTVQHSIDLTTIHSGGPSKDGIPSIDDPKFVTTYEAEFLSDDDLGILLTINDDTRFYPYRILNWHEIVNDTVGSEPVFITYCPLCATGVVYSREISKGEVEFGVSGMLSESNLLMYDRATDSLWNQVSGQAVVGELTGEQLGFVRSDIVAFSTVQSLHPSARVLSTDTGEDRDYTYNPYHGYEDKEGSLFHVSFSDDRLFSKEIVYGVVLNGLAKAYKLEDLQNKERIEDSVGGIDILFTYDPGTEEITARRSTGELVQTLPIFWFAWVAQHPYTELWGEE